MSQALINKIRQSRQKQVAAGNYHFTVRRPTNLEISKMRGVADTEDLLRKFVIDWDLTELDVYSGGTADRVPFEPDLFVEWVADRPELWGPLTDAIVEAYKAHEARQVDELKN